ncbi:VOC family protein [Sphingomonas oligophenolica]|nr:VOC family protein [Sphingomonas oligophenolica]
MTTAQHRQIVFTEIPVVDPGRARQFYELLLEGPLIEDNGGPNPIWVFPHAEGVSAAAGHLYPGKPAKDGEGMTAHFAVTEELTAVMDRVKSAGGDVVSDVLDIYPGSFFYAKDTEGDSLGIFKYNR